MNCIRFRIVRREAASFSSALPQFNPPLLKPAYTSYLVFVWQERERGRKRARGIGKRNLPDGYESLGTIWNPEVAPWSTAVMDKSSRGEKLNVELVSNHFRKRIVPSEQLSINFRRARAHQRDGNIFFFIHRTNVPSYVSFLIYAFWQIGRKSFSKTRDKIFDICELGCSCLLGNIC